MECDDNDPDDLDTCEACGARGSYETFTTMEDCSFCRACTAEWDAEFAACEHRWVHAQNCDGEPAACCEKCSGMVAIEDFERHGFDLSTVQPAAAACAGQGGG